MGRAGFLNRDFFSVLFRWGLAAAGATASLSAFAYTLTMARDGTPVRWPKGSRLALAGNFINQSGLSERQVFDSVVTGLQSWKAASGGKIVFDFWLGSDPSIYEPNSEYNGLSSVYFASNESGKNQVSPSILGLTQVWYDTRTGRAFEADIVLNDMDYQFTTDPRDTSGSGLTQGSLPAGSFKRRVFIGNVISHELGHAVGLSHTAGLQSTLLFMEGPEQAQLGCDDQVAAQALFASGSPVGGRSSLTGRVVSPGGAPLLGAHVLAISQQRGVVLATALTDAQGIYRLDALEPGPYFLLVEPFYAGASVLPDYFGSIQHSVCSGRLFSRTFLMETGTGRPRSVRAAAGVRGSVPEISVSCSGTESGGAAIFSEPLSASRVTAPELLSPTMHGAGALVDRLDDGSYRYYRLSGVSGTLVLRAQSHSLYSPVRVTQTLLTAEGRTVASQAEPIYRGDSGFLNFDSELRVSNLPQGDYVLRISGAPIQYSVFPAGSMAMDSVPFVLLTATQNAAAPPLVGELQPNARCRMLESWEEYRSPGGLPERSPLQGGDGVGFCGTVQNRSSEEPSGPRLEAVVGWFLPYALMVLVSRAVPGISVRTRRVARRRVAS